VTRDSSVGIATRLGAGNFYFHYRVPTSSGAQSASYTMSTGGSFHGGNAAGA